ncbi:advillin-like isoform X2 [Physella acuta]|nr:advillin-like isoform X2 [Physella acuta]
MQVKGKRNIRVKQVKCDVSSLNQGDVFILDCGLVIFVWNGPTSSKMERHKAADVARRIKDEERGGKAVVKIIEERWETDAAFFKALGSNGTIAPAGQDDQAFEQALQEEIQLFRVSDASGSLEMTRVGSKQLNRETLDSNDCFILDSGTSGIFVWIGKNCTKNEKKSAWKNATDFLKLRGYPDWTPVTQVVEGGETPLFKQYFTSWTSADEQKGLGIVHKTEQIAKYNSAKFDTTILHKSNKREQEILPDNGTGQIKCWRVENNDLVLQTEETHGIFYTGDCYVLLYTYATGGRQQYIIYFWQGCKSSVEERAASAIFAQLLDDRELGGSAVQIRVTQGNEPEHFLRIFQGKLIILMGGVNNKEPESPVRILQVRGSSDINTRAMQVVSRAASLNSNDVFLIETETYVYLWYGKGSSTNERIVARKFLNYLCPDRNDSEIQEVEEGEEEPDFWHVLGGQEPYASGKAFQVNEINMPARLFHCSNSSGRFNVEEIVGFTQEDLLEDDVMILDTIEEVYVWVGKGANEIEKKESLQIALDYIKHDPMGRNDETTVILQVKQGFEPPSFTGIFLGWDPEKWSQGKSFEDLKRELGEENLPITFVRDEIASYDQKFTYADLLKKTPPKGVDLSRKERHLTEEEFSQIFKMTRLQFEQLREWKQLELKKKVGLF